jgi:prolyl oligopeptidase
VVIARDAVLDGRNPTQLWAYGGFEISYQPSYSAIIGRNWLEQGGVYVLANIRGGGEFGPSWHQAGLLKNRHKVYEDFEAVAEDLIARNITSSRHLGIRGGSNGGLLVGAAVTRRPDLYNAVISQVPLLDMQRYSKLLAGASWMGEYGDPDQEDMWTYIRSYSPYHNVHADVTYPTIFFTTSTRDDRVHPGHARKMVAKMLDQGHEVLYYENTEGGHAGAANNAQRAQLDALIYAYFLERLKE